MDLLAGTDGHAFQGAECRQLVPMVDELLKHDIHDVRNDMLGLGG